MVPGKFIVLHYHSCAFLRTWLIDFLYHRYSKRSDTKKYFTWRCTSRSAIGQYAPCKAYVKQQKNSANIFVDYAQSDFEFHAHSADELHSHPPVPGIEHLVCIYRECKKKSVEEHFVPASKVLMAVLKDRHPMAGSHMPKEVNLKRVINNARAKIRPKNPAANDPDFIVDIDYFSKVFEESFYIDEVRADGARHFLFATKAQLTQLSRAKVVYCDGTFLLVNKPFMQLFSINGMLTSSEGNTFYLSFPVTCQ